MSFAPDAVHFNSICVGALHSTGEDPTYDMSSRTDEFVPPPLVVGGEEVVGVVAGPIDGTLVLAPVDVDAGVVVVDVSVESDFLWLLLHAASSTIPRQINERRSVRTPRSQGRRSEGAMSIARS